MTKIITGKKLLRFAKLSTLFLLNAAIITLVIFSVGSELNDRYFLFDLLAQFRLQYAVLLLVSVAFLACRKQYPFMLVALVTCIFNFSLIVPFYFPAPKYSATTSTRNSDAKISSSTDTGKKLRLVTMNTNVRNEYYLIMLKYLKDTNPDAFVIEELSDSLLQELRKQFPSYKYQFVRPSDTPSGLGIFSKLEMTDKEVWEDEFTDRASIKCSLNLDGKLIPLVVIHTDTPTTALGFRIQNAQFDQLATRCKDLGPNLIVTGDFNSTSWTKKFQQFRSRLKLTDSRTGFGVQPSWPAAYPITKIPGLHRYVRIHVPVLHCFVMIPIDHVLVGSGITVTAREIGHDNKSDHYPVLIDMIVH